MPIDPAETPSPTPTLRRFADGVWSDAFPRRACARGIRILGFADHRAARRSVDAMLDWPFERITVGHGVPVTKNARESQVDAYA